MTDFRKLFSTDPEHRSTQVLLVAILGVALVGFIVGINQTSLHIDGLSKYGEHEVATPADGLDARTYKELMSDPLNRNRGWEKSVAELAEKTRPSLLEPVENPEAGKEATLAFRAQRRAYAGAPPTIPHPIKQGGDASCLACHRTGVEIQGRLAPAMSHEEKSQCTQCHVVSNAPMPGAETESYLLSTSNSFTGLPEPRDGVRAWPGAPATIPHSTQMRSDCMSCHGLNGRQGLRTSHPWRQNCVQCHVPSAELDQGPLNASPPFFKAE